MPKEKRFHSKPFKKERYFNSNKSFEKDEISEKKIKLGVISEELLSYYRNVSFSLENEFEDSDLKEQFLTNVYAALKDEGLQVSQNQTVSRILETLFTHSQPHHMIELFNTLSRELTIVTFDRFASHVFQALIKYLPAMYEVKKETEQKISAASLQKSVEQVCTFMESHMRDVMTHTYASHVLRSLLEALSGAKVNEEVLRSRQSRLQRKVEPSNHQKFTGKLLAEEFKNSFIKLKDKILNLCNFEDHLKDINYCPVLQTVLLILHKTSPKDYVLLSNTILKKTCVMPETNDDSDIDVMNKKLPHIVQNEIGSYLIELLIALASEAQLQEIYNLIFKDKLIYFAVHPVANFILQRLISSILERKLMGEIMTEILRYTEDILAANHLGIITKMAESCQKNNFGQSEFFSALTKAFHCNEPDSRQIKLVPLLASLQTYEVFFGVGKETKTPEEVQESGHFLRSVNIHGSLVLQQLLQFKNTKLVTSSLLELSPAEVSVLCCDKCGSHVIDIFFQSMTVPEKYKTALIKHLQGMYINIACNRNGSRCLENIWKHSPMGLRQLIAEELCKSQDRIESDQWGRFLYNNFALFKFKHRKQEWLEIQGASLKKQRLLQEVLHGTERTKEPKNKKGAGKNLNESSTAVTTCHKSLEDYSKKKIISEKSVSSFHLEQTVGINKSVKDSGKKKKISKKLIKSMESTHQEQTEETVIPHVSNQERKRKWKNEKQPVFPNSTKYSASAAPANGDDKKKRKRKISTKLGISNEGDDSIPKKMKKKKAAESFSENQNKTQAIISTGTADVKDKKCKKKNK